MFGMFVRPFGRGMIYFISGFAHYFVAILKGIMDILMAIGCRGGLLIKIFTKPIAWISTGYFGTFKSLYFTLK